VTAAVAAPAVPVQAGPVDEPAAPVGEVAQAWALIVRAQSGDAAAFGDLFKRYQDTVYRFVYGRLGGKRHLAEDLTQDVFLRAWRRIGSFTWQGRDPGAWFVTIARNAVADHFKSGRYRLEVLTGDMFDTDRTIGEEHGPVGLTDAYLRNRDLMAALTRLNPQQQEVIVLRFIHGLTVGETAQAIGKNVGAVKAMQMRAVRALARLLPAGFEEAYR
jgi:RNA polymerase sigma-70 factor (ECF subfamily)